MKFSVPHFPAAIAAVATLGAFLHTAAPLHAAPSLAVRDLKCEYRVDPLGIDTPAPRLSWILQSKRRGERQSAFQIVAGTNERELRTNRGALWDSGKVASAETTQIAYGGRPLASEQEVWWKVRAWDGEGQPSDFSAPARWTMGLLRPTDWQARWIGLRKLPGNASNTTLAALQGLSWVWFPEGNPAASAPPGTRYFRKQLSLPAGRKVKAASLTLTADDQWTLWINGAQIGRSDGQGYAWQRPAALDVTRNLGAGNNVLAIAAQNQEGPAGLAGRLQVDFEDGASLSLPIDASWKSATSADNGWNTIKFNDEAWSAAKAVAAMGGGPWAGVAQRGAVIPPAPFVRKTFMLAKPIRRAYAYATALGLYELHLNGQRVGQDVFSPGWTDYRKRVYYQTYDVTSLLRRGPNAAGLVIGDGWATGHVGNGGRDRYGLGRPRAAVQLDVAYSDGTRQIITTDGSWKAAYGPIEEQDLLDGETYDARREMNGWDRPGFNDASWQPVDVFENSAARIEAYPGVPVRRMLQLRPRGITQPRPGHYVFDLGQNMVGWARLAATGPAGTKVTLRFAEMLNPDGTIYTTNLRGARCIDSYTLKGAGREVWEPRFTFHGFRYVELTGYPGRPSADALTGIVVHSDTPQTGTFACSNPMVNKLQQNIEWGQRGNFLEVPTDCPQRDERLGWMGDAQIFARTAANNMDVSAFFSKWMVDVEDAMRGDAFPDVAPDVCCGAGTPAWADAGVIVPWTIYQVYGDKRIIARHYDAMRRYIGFIEAANPNLLWAQKRGSDYGDWLSIRADSAKDVIGTSYFAYSTALLAKMARVIGREDDARRYEALCARIKEAYNLAFVAPDGRIKGNTQTVYLMALQMDLLPEEKRASAARYLVEDIKSRDWHLSTGFVGVGYMTPVLTRFGYTDVAYRLLNNDTFPSWGYSIKHGATTIWERWDGWTQDKGFQDPGMNSFNHYALGSVGQWMFSTVAGIDTDAEQPGFKHIIIRPRPGGGLRHARATYDSIRGRIASAWSVNNGVFALDVAIPANTTATIYVPMTGEGKIVEGGRPVEQAPGVHFVRREDGNVIFAVGAGTYRFRAPSS